MNWNFTLVPRYFKWLIKTDFHYIFVQFFVISWAIFGTDIAWYTLLFYGVCWRSILFKIHDLVTEGTTFIIWCFELSRRLYLLNTLIFISSKIRHFNIWNWGYISFIVFWNSRNFIQLMWFFDANTVLLNMILYFLLSYLIEIKCFLITLRK